MVLTCDLSMLVRYCLYARKIFPLCSYGIAFMFVPYCFYDCTVLLLWSYGIICICPPDPLFLLWTYVIPSRLVRHNLHMAPFTYSYGINCIWPFTLSSHGHRRYWPVTCPCSYGIASMLAGYVGVIIGIYYRVLTSNSDSTLLIPLKP